MPKFKAGYNLKLHREENIVVPLRYDLATYCHILLTGSSGSGKSYSIVSLLASIVKNYENIRIYFCDFKNSEDFSFLKGYEYYFEGDRATEGILSYYDAFTKARQNRDTAVRHMLIVDEYPSMLNFLQGQDKINKTKIASEVQSAIAEVLMLGRGIEFGCLITTQRADSSLFSNGARDNFQMVIALGRLSKEQKSMVFAGEEIPDLVFSKGEGCLLADGKELQLVKFPHLQNIKFIKEQIKTILIKDVGAEECTTSK